MVDPPRDVASHGCRRRPRLAAHPCRRDPCPQRLPVGRPRAARRTTRTDRGAGAGSVRLRPSRSRRRRHARDRRPAARGRATPGHTPDTWPGRSSRRCLPAVRRADRRQPARGSAGRTDLLGADAAEELTRAQFGSLRALARLPEDVAVLPTHGPGSFCSAGRSMAGGRRRRHERRMNPLLAASTSRRSARPARGPGAYPTYYEAMAPINRAGPVVLGRPRRPDAGRGWIPEGGRRRRSRRRRPVARGVRGGPSARIAQHRAQ